MNWPLTVERPSGIGCWPGPRVMSLFLFIDQLTVKSSRALRVSMRFEVSRASTPRLSTSPILTKRDDVPAPEPVVTPPTDTGLSTEMSASLVVFM